MSLAFGTTRPGWWMNGKALKTLNTSCLSELSRIMAAKHSCVWTSLTDNEVQTFLEGEENQYTKRKTESYVFSGFGVSISLGWEWGSATGRFATNRFWPSTWKTSSVGKDKFNKWEFWTFFNLPSNFRDETWSKTTSMLIRNGWLSFLSRVKIWASLCIWSLRYCQKIFY